MTAASHTSRSPLVDQSLVDQLEQFIAQLAAPPDSLIKLVRLEIAKNHLGTVLTHISLRVRAEEHPTIANLCASHNWPLWSGYDPYAGWDETNGCYCPEQTAKRARLLRHLRRLHELLINRS